MTLSEIIGYTLIGSAIALKLYLIIDSEIEKFNKKKRLNAENQTARKFDFFYRNIEASNNYFQLQNTENLIQNFCTKECYQDSRYHNMINALRRKRVEIMNKYNNIETPAPCMN